MPLALPVFWGITTSTPRASLSDPNADRVRFLDGCHVDSGSSNCENNVFILGRGETSSVGVYPWMRSLHCAARRNTCEKHWQSQWHTQQCHLADLLLNQRSVDEPEG